MAERLEETAAEVLSVVQRGIPVVPRPFAAVGEQLSLPEETVLETLRSLQAQGLVRRFGAVFDSRSLGYASTLCAVDVPPERIESAANSLNPHPGITHCYEREGHPNLWFTLTAPSNALDTELARLADRLAPLRIHNLPALRRFKIDVVFDLSGGDAQNTPAKKPPRAPEAVALSEREQAVVRRMQGSIPCEPQPFHSLADELGYGVEELLALLRAWLDRGIIRRIGAIARHRNLGFTANAMCVWSAPADTIEAAGASLAGCPEVTHCYERPSSTDIPFNLYAMVHAGTRERAAEILDRISRAAGLRDGRMLVSVREFKKSSPVFFTESETHAEGGASR